MKRKGSAAQDANGALRTNPEVLITELQAENAELREKLAVTKLQSENSDLRKKLSAANSRLDAIDDVLADDDDAYADSDRLDDIQSAIDRNGNGDDDGDDDD